MTTRGDHTKIVIIGFNIGEAGSYVNGPGCCLFNFVNFLKKSDENIKIDIYCEIPKGRLSRDLEVRSLSDPSLSQSIRSCDVVHLWSGMTQLQKNALVYASHLGKKIIIGPNVIDTVNFDKEQSFLFNGLGDSKINYSKILTTNDKLNYKIAKDHRIPLGKIEKFLVGPDIKQWRRSENKGEFILWKGNSKHFVKDVEFALRVKEALPQYRFKFFGHPKPYDYLGHIDEAKRAKLYFSTSMSETMGLTLVEQWACGTPSVTHPKIYMHGENYKTGIITNKTIEDYCQAITEIMEDESLCKKLSTGAEEFVKNNFSRKAVLKNYFTILENLGVM